MKRIAFIQIGQSSGGGFIADMAAELGVPIAGTEFGALDGYSRAELADWAPGPDDAGLLTTMADGSPIVVGKRPVSDSIERILSRVGPADHDLVVIFTTGLFTRFESRCLMVNGQRAIESGVMTFAAAGQRVGIVVPLERQERMFYQPALSGYRHLAGHAAPGDTAALEAMGLQMREADAIFLNSVDFREADQRVLAAASGKPVVLARRLIVGAVRIVLDLDRSLPAAGGSSVFAQRVALLTARERQVMWLTAEGLPTKLVGRQMGISPKTIEAHRSKVFAKMEVATSAELIRLVMSEGAAVAPRKAD